MINLVTQHLKVEPVKVDLADSVEVSLDSQVVLMTLGIFFQVFFGGGGSRRNPNAPRQGEDLLHRIRISFEDAVFGTKKTIKTS